MFKTPEPPDYPLSGSIKYWIGRAWLGLFGWKATCDIPSGGKFILIGAHHTSNWDLPFGLAAVYIFRLKVSWLGKQSLFKGPFGLFMRSLGGVPVDRENPNGVVGQIADQYHAAEKLVIAMAPSGTRSKREYWRSGFYWMAKEAGVPILCGYLDYQQKRAHIGLCLTPSDDIKGDMDKIRDFYAEVVGKRPESTTPVRLRDET